MVNAVEDLMGVYGLKQDYGKESESEWIARASDQLNHVADQIQKDVETGEIMKKGYKGMVPIFIWQAIDAHIRMHRSWNEEDVLRRDRDNLKRRVAELETFIKTFKEFGGKQ